VTEGHEVYLDVTRDDYARRILAEIEAGRGASQRSLARSAGIALGLTNLVLRNLVRKGWVRITRVKPNRVRYLITPAGIAEKARMSRAYFAYTTRFYAETRARVRERFAALSHAWPVDRSSDPAVKRVAFYGGGDVSEIGYICLQETDLQMSVVFDGAATRRFFGTPVLPVAALQSPAEWQRFDVLVVMTFDVTELARARAVLTDAHFPPDRVFWI
jgi:DNA-binding MarR family transcriptional regulator